MNNFKLTSKVFIKLVMVSTLAVPSINFANDDDDDRYTATDFSTGYDFKQLDGVSQRLAPHGNDLMGDQVDKKTGSFSLSHTDISIPGNSNLEVAPYIALTEMYDASLKMLDTVNNSLTEKVKMSNYGKRLQKYINNIKQAELK